MKIRKTFKIKADINQLEVGDVISFKLKDGEKVEARAAKREGDKMLMHFVDCLEGGLVVLCCGEVFRYGKLR